MVISFFYEQGFLFAARQRVQRNDTELAFRQIRYVSIRCSTASTAERESAIRWRPTGEPFLFAARQRVQRNERKPESSSTSPPSFYSLLDSEYSGTSTQADVYAWRFVFLFAARQRVQRNGLLGGDAAHQRVSIRCSTASTAERRGVHRCDVLYRFYSLLDSEYSGTLHWGVLHQKGLKFLFAARQRVQRNDRVVRNVQSREGFYSLLDSEYSGTRDDARPGRRAGRPAGFLFAARQRVQRNLGRGWLPHPLRHRVSIRCSTASTAEPARPAMCRSAVSARFYSLLDSEYSGTATSPPRTWPGRFLFAARQRVQRNVARQPQQDQPRLDCFYSLLDSEYSGTPGAGLPRTSHGLFLFAARQRVQRNAGVLAFKGLQEQSFYSLLDSEYSGTSTYPWVRGTPRRFYSLLDSEYSGTTATSYWVRLLRQVSIRCSTASTAELGVPSRVAEHIDRFLFAARQRVQRNLVPLLIEPAFVFLFAARQRVQRNDKLYTEANVANGFYSLLDSEYSGTDGTSNVANG